MNVLYPEMPPRRPKRRRPLSARRRASVRGTLALGGVLAVLVVVNLYVFLWSDSTSIPAVMDKASMAGEGSPAVDADTVEALRGAVSDLAVSGAGGEDGAGAESDDADHVQDTGRWVEGAVEKGDSLGRILTREGLVPDERDAVIRALRDHLDFRAIRVGQTYRIHFDDAGRVLVFEFVVSRVTTVRARRDASGSLVGEVKSADTELRLEGVGGRIDSSLWAAVKATGEDTQLVSFFVDVFAYDLNFFVDTHEGDTFRMLIEKEYLDGEFLGYGRIHGAEYSGKAGTFRAFTWKAPDKDEWTYYDEKGRSVEKSLLKTPLKFSRISSKFNPNRMHPILHRRRGHFGVDYAAPKGTPVWAAAPGRIVGRSYMGGGGNTVILKHDNGMSTLYLHLSKFRRGQKVGQYVRAKTVIGYVGSTGMSTGPHLHFSVKQNGRYVDPLKLKPKRRGPPVPRKHRPAFDRDIGIVTASLATIPLPPPAASVEDALAVD